MIFVFEDFEDGEFICLMYYSLLRDVGGMLISSDDDPFDEKDLDCGFTRIGEAVAYKYIPPVREPYLTERPESG